MALEDLEVYSFTDGSWEVNGIITYAKEFAYDGCHKIYLIETPEDREEAFGYGYKEEDFFLMENLKAVFINSCPLRFISSFDLRTRFVEQFEFDDEEDYKDD